MMSKLFEPLTIRSLTLKNRLAMSPMCQYSADNGFVNSWHEIHYGTRAVGGVGTIVVEATAVADIGRITPRDLGIWDDSHVAGLAKIATIIQSHGAVPAIQLAHAGRKASHSVPWEGGAQLASSLGGWKTIAPSSIPFVAGEIPPIEMDLQTTDQVVEQFRDAAVRALKAGFRIAEIHAAHGYLLHEFLSPLSNHRTDSYGGSFENRIRLVCEVATEVRRVWPVDLPLFVRLSATDWQNGGWDVEQSVALADQLKEIGVDLIDCSSGGNIADARIPVAHGYQVPFAHRVRSTGILTGAVGIITSALQAEAILEDNSADLIFLGRELLRNPYFPLQAAKALDVEVDWPIQYHRGR